MKSIGVLVLVVSIAVMIIPATTYSQWTQSKTKTVDASEVMLLPELGAMIELDQDTLTVTMVMPPDDRKAAYKEVDLQEGDRLLMCNGKRIASIEQLRSLIDSLATGTTVKLGLRRDGALRMASYSKGNPDDLPKRMMMVTQAEGPGGDEKVVSIGGGDSEEGQLMVLDGGIVIGKGEAGLEIVAMLPGATDKLTGEMPAKGDILVGINGNLDHNVAAFNQLYESIPDGDKIIVTFKRDGKTMTASYTKAPTEHGGRMIIRK